MNVKELIEKLQVLDPDLMVVRSGYEGGVKEVNSLEVIEIALNVNDEWYYGSHEPVSDLDTYEGFQKAKAVWI